MPVTPHKAVIVNALAANIASDPLAFEPWELLRLDHHAHPLLVEKVPVAHLTISTHLLLVLVFNRRIHFPRQGLGRFFRRDANRPISRKVDKRCRHLSPVTKLQCPFSKTASGHDADCICRAAVYFNIGDQPLAIFAARVFNSETRAAEHGHAYAKYLPCAKMSMCDLSLPEQVVESIHICYVW